jgi:hypothetical protein
MAEIFNAIEKRELEKFINCVSEIILQGNMSLFLGAGSSIQYDAMSWNDLINKIYTGCENWKNTERAQYAELKGKRVKDEVSNVIASVNINSNKVNTYLNHLLKFDYKSLWTTNYDSVIENILDNKSKKYIPVYKYEHFKNLSYPGGCFLFKINGSCNSPETIVITREDFIKYRKSHEAYLILMKRELLCHSFLFLGCSFDDDILRMCIKDILNCIENSKENYATNHFVIISECNKERLDFISNDLVKNYNINCLCVNNTENAYITAYGISCKIKYNSIFISGAKNFARYSEEENDGKKVCQTLVNAFMKINEFPFKFICGMGMSIGHFISGTIKQLCNGKNLNRHLQMEPFPFTSQEANENHRKSLVNKAGIFIFLFGDFGGDINDINKSGMWNEYLYAKKDENNILIPLPCGKFSMSNCIYEREINDKNSFSFMYNDLLQKFDYMDSNEDFFFELVEKIIITTRKKMDCILDEIVSSIKTCE